LAPTAHHATAHTPRAAAACAAAWHVVNFSSWSDGVGRMKCHYSAWWRKTNQHGGVATYAYAPYSLGYPFDLIDEPLSDRFASRIHWHYRFAAACAALRTYAGCCRRIYQRTPLAGSVLCRNIVLYRRTRVSLHHFLQNIAAQRRRCIGFAARLSFGLTRAIIMNACHNSRTSTPRLDDVVACCGTAFLRITSQRITRRVPLCVLVDNAL